LIVVCLREVLLSLSSRFGACLSLICVVVACSSCGLPVRGTNKKSASETKGARYCVTGSSDPWIDSFNTWEDASQQAMKELFTELRPAGLRAAVVTVNSSRDGDWAEQMTISEVKAMLSGAGVVGWWLDRDGKGPLGICGNRCNKATVWAVACLDGQAGQAPGVMPEAFRGAIPSWMRAAPAPAGRVCGIGISGPTIVPDDALTNAVEDARRWAALRICAVGDHAFIDYMSGGTWSFADSVPSREALAWVRSHADTEAESVLKWLDIGGDGPLGTAGMGYARVCIPATTVECGEP